VSASHFSDPSEKPEMKTCFVVPLLLLVEAVHSTSALARPVPAGCPQLETGAAVSDAN
jgi:hypothetical protein